MLMTQARKQHLVRHRKRRRQRASLALAGIARNVSPINDQVEASIDGYSGTHKAVKDNGDPNSGFSTYQSTLSSCMIKVSYTCNGTAYTQWIDTSNCHPPYYDNIPAGIDCSKHG